MSEHSFIPTIKVKGFCPVCAHPDPEVTTDAWLRCTNPECPSPDLIANVLLDNEIGHVVRFFSGMFNVRHPLRERVESELLDCQIHDVVNEALDEGMIDPTGTWRLTGNPGGPDQDPDWEWERIDE